MMVTNEGKRRIGDQQLGVLFDGGKVRCRREWRRGRGGSRRRHRPGFFRGFRADNAASRFDRFGRRNRTFLKKATIKRHKSLSPVVVHPVSDAFRHR